MILVGAILGQGVWILFNIGATHNVIDSSIARTIGQAECRITTTVLIDSGTEPAYQGACFTVLLHINGETFQTDVFLLSIGDNIDVILGAHG
jgi:hypothetical protein